MGFDQILAVLASLVPTQYQHYWIGFIALLGAFGGVVKFLDVVFRLGKSRWPSSKFWVTGERWSSYLAPRWPQSPDQIHEAAVREAAKLSPPKGLIALFFAPVVLVLTVVALLLFGGCATLQPTFYAGPTVAPIEEVTGKNPQPAAAAGFTEKVGFGKYTDAAGLAFDYFEIGALELGGYVPGGSPAGMLQLGGAVSSFNGLIGIGILFDCFDSSGNGACQQGRPGGPIFAAMIDIQAIVADFFTPSSATESAMPRKRGGFMIGPQL
jgi:hypothetical protein